MDQVTAQALAMFDKLQGKKEYRERLVVPASQPKSSITVPSSTSVPMPIAARAAVRTNGSNGSSRSSTLIAEVAALDEDE
jgi:hypothetical protein